MLRQHWTYSPLLTMFTNEDDALNHYRITVHKSACTCKMKIACFGDFLKIQVVHLYVHARTFEHKVHPWPPHRGDPTRHPKTVNLLACQVISIMYIN